MNHMKYNDVPDELLNKIIRVAYGDAGMFKKWQLKILAKKNRIVGELLSEYRETARNVHSLKSDECPEEILSKVEVVTVKKSDNKLSIIGDLYNLVFSKPLVTAIAVSVIVVAIVSSLFIDRSKMYDGYSLEEVERANFETRKAIALVSKIFIRTEKSIKEEILAERIGKPINQGIESVNKLFKEEGEIK